MRRSELLEKRTILAKELKEKNDPGDVMTIFVEMMRNDRILAVFQCESMDKAGRVVAYGIAGYVPDEVVVIGESYFLIADTTFGDLPKRPLEKLREEGDKRVGDALTITVADKQGVVTRTLPFEHRDGKYEWGVPLDATGKETTGRLPELINTVYEQNGDRTPSEQGDRLTTTVIAKTDLILGMAVDPDWVENF